MTLSNEQREEIKRDYLKFCEEHPHDEIYSVNVRDFESLLSSEQALQKENERLLAFCKLLASEEEMYQEGRYETEMSRLQASEQALREEVNKLQEADINTIILDQLNQAIEVITAISRRRMDARRTDEQKLNMIYGAAISFLSSLQEVTHEMDR